MYSAVVGGTCTNVPCTAVGGEEISQNVNIILTAASLTVVKSEYQSFVLMWNLPSLMDDGLL